MPVSRRSRSLAAAALGMALLAAACGGPTQSYGGRTELSPPANRGNRLRTTPSPASTDPAREAPPPTHGRLVVTVVDGRGRPRSDIPIRVEPEAGGAATTATSELGRVALRLRAGRYRVEAPLGCAERVVVRSVEGAGTAGIAAGRTLAVTLTVEAERRYAPAAPSWSTNEPPWASDEIVPFRFKLVDHAQCGDRDATNLRFDDLVYRPSAHLRLVDAPRRTGADAYVTIRFRCVRSGDASLFLVDPETGEGADLLGLRTPYDPSAVWCG